MTVSTMHREVIDGIGFTPYSVVRLDINRTVDVCCSISGTDFRNEDSGVTFV